MAHRVQIELHGSPQRAWLAALLCALGGSATAAGLPPPGLPTAASTPASNAATARIEPAIPAGAQPVPDDVVDNPIPPARVVSPEPQIQQVHSGRRVAEVVVVPAGSSVHYTLVNHDGPRQPTSPLDTTSNLSTQRFFRVDF